MTKHFPTPEQQVVRRLALPLVTEGTQVRNSWSSSTQVPTPTNKAQAKGGKGGLSIFLLFSFNSQ